MAALLQRGLTKIGGSAVNRTFLDETRNTPDALATQGRLRPEPDPPARQRSHLAAACSPGKLLGVPGGAFAVRAGVLAHGKAHRTAQSCRTATSAHTAKACTHGKGDAHDKAPAARQPRARTAKAIAVQNVDAHGKGAVAVGFVAVHALPCI
jgi:hypothetical protein